ncbi:MAG: ferrous iron transport protein B [Sandaracinaceae bacterium]
MIAAPALERRPRIALAGNPNAGKTTLFNALTGASARTGNYPGVTVERRVGVWQLPGGREVEVVDVPGTYSLSARSPEEQVAVDTVLPPEGGASPDAVIVVADAGALERHLYLAQQIVDAGVPVVLALNLMDEARRAGVQIDVGGLATALGVAAVPVVATKGEGVPELAAAVGQAIDAELGAPTPEPVDDIVEPYLAPIEAWLREHGPEEPAAAIRARALWALLSIGDDELDHVDPGLRRVVLDAQARAEAADVNLDRAIIAGRYARIDDHMRFVVSASSERGPSWTDRIDGALTHPVLGMVVFALVMLVLFETLFRWSDPLIGGIEEAVGFTQTLVSGWLPEGPLRGLLVDGVIAGVGNVIVFVPQIGLLFAFIAILEDSGYLARVAFVIDRLMRGVGLHGKAFVPLLSGFACAIPAVMATRTIENRKDRLVTMLALPLMSCSARLPVYALVIAIVFPANERVGFVSVGALVLFSMYALSVGSTLGAAAVLRRTVLKGPRPALVLELPPYRWPAPRNVLTSVWRRVKDFLVDAGTIILAITVILWAMLSYLKDDSVSARFEDLRAEAAAQLEGEALRGARGGARRAGGGRADALQRRRSRRALHRARPRAARLRLAHRHRSHRLVRGPRGAREHARHRLGHRRRLRGERAASRRAAERAPRRRDAALHAAHRHRADGLLRPRRAVHEHHRGGAA